MNLRLVHTLLLGTLLLPVAVHAQAPAAEPALDPAWAAEFDWQSIGPATMGGRITDLAVCETDPSLYFVATASGGLLKTANGGITFEHLFQHEATVSIGAVCLAPSNPDIVWVGTGEENPRNSVSYGDGVYKSTDGGVTWQRMGLEDSFQIASIVVHPSDPDIVYVGALGRLWGPSAERGLYKTTDGGATWSQILSVDERTGVVDIAMHPEDPDTLLVATWERQRDGFDTNDPAKKWGPGSGLWRTTDGGATFTEVTEGLPTCQLGRIDVDWYRKDPNVLFALVESEKIGMAGADVGWSGIETQDAQIGARVREIAEVSPAAAAGLQVDDVVIAVGGTTVLTDVRFREALATFGPGETVALEVAREGESHVIEVTLDERPSPRSRRRGRGGDEAGAEERDEAGGEERDEAGGEERDEEGAEEVERPFGTRLGGQVANVQRLQGRNGHEHGGLYRSNDGGLTWTRINSIDPRPMYFSKVRVDPSDARRIYVLGISLARSEDGGETFTDDAGRGVHSDQHALWIDPADGRHMILGTDGGFYVTRDRCATWRHENHMALGQFYHVAVGPRRDYRVYGGLQDNGTWGAPRRSARGSGTINEDWLRIGGGDGFVVQVDQDDPDRIYYESQNGGMGRTHLATMEGGRIRPRGERGVEYRFNWRTPFILSHHNSRIFYCAGNHVFRSLSKGDDLKSISPEITRTERGSATALAESPRDPDVLWVGTDDGALWTTADGGQQWTDLLAWEDAADIGAATPAEADLPANGGPRAAAEASAGSAPLRAQLPGPLWVSAIEVSRFEDGRVYVTFDAHRSDDDGPYVYVTEDHGRNWRSLNANLPRGSTRVIREDIDNPNLLYLGTEFGLWVSVDRGASWTRFHGDQLPTVPVHEIAQHPTCGEIVVATHGRSLWVVDVTPLRQTTEQVLASDTHLFEPNDVVQWRRRHRRGSSGGASSYSGENPSDEARIFYRLPEGARSVELTIHDAAGEPFRTLEPETDAGLHAIEWDLRGDPRAPSAAEMAELERRFGQRARRFGGRNRAPSAAPGTYRVVLTVDGRRYEQRFSVLGDPGFPAETAADVLAREFEAFEAEAEAEDGR